MKRVGKGEGVKVSKKVILATVLIVGAVWIAKRRRKPEASQAWFRTPEWQAGEREVDEALARGESTVFEDPEDMFRNLEA